MKTILKQILMLAVLMLAVPAFAAEGPTKGTKSYQAARSEQPAQQQADDAPANAEEAAQVAPAAGDTQSDAQADQGKTMREEMKLPRKN